MIISKHAKIRSQQRNIPINDIELIMQFGTPLPKPGGAVEYSISKKDKNNIIKHLKYLINIISNIDNKSVLIKEDCIITVYYKNQQKFYQHWR